MTSRGMMERLAIAGLFLSGLFAAPIGILTNCTGGEADLAQLPIFLVPALLSAIALVLLRPSGRLRLLALLAATPLLIVAMTLVNAAWGWFRRGETACQSLYGHPYPADGSEGLTPYMLALIAVILLLGGASFLPRKN